ncbi:hypothetical protein Cgig2_026165 [Carnegiea gigantea]|uniref:Nuclear pore complex protein n=1 Tax=Carnegiea gigantea TaxID=171969 RepID=A0A9Q1K3Z4_9CARY|nr:hypothetical protein Cgig2_026165 [Carnegiea gigantea]
MVSPMQLLSTIESALLGPTPPSPSERVELMHAIRSALPSLQNLLSYPPPRPSDRAEVQSKEVRLPDSPPISLDDQDVQIALKLSYDFYLNEIDCVRLLVLANQEAVVLDQGVEGDLVADIQKYLEDLINSGLRQRLINLLKELNREEPTGLGSPNGEKFVIDAHGALVERRAVVSRERLILSHCLVLSVLVVRPSPIDVKDIFSVLKDSAAELNDCTDTTKYQIAYGILFSLVIAFTSDALSTVPEKASVLSCDTSFRQEFQEIIMAPVNDPTVGGFVDCVRLAWAVHLIVIQGGIAVRDIASLSSSKDVQNISSCLEVIFSNNVFQFFLDKILHTAAYQNDDEDMVYMYNAYLHKLITIFLSEPLARDKVKEVKEKAMAMLSPHHMATPHGFSHEDNANSDQAVEMRCQPFISLLEFIGEIYQWVNLSGVYTVFGQNNEPYVAQTDKEPELLSGNEVVWTFVNFAGEDHTNFQTLVAFLNILGALASSQESAAKVYELLQGKTFRSVSWSTLFDCVSIYAEKFKQSLQTTGSMLPEFPEGDAKALVAYLNVLRKVMENGNPVERKDWFPDIEPLFKLLSYENVPPFLKGALRDAIATFINVSPLMKDIIWGFLEQYDLPVVVGTQVGSSTHPISTQVYDMQFELNEIEARRERYPSTISFINLVNALISEERDPSDKGRRMLSTYEITDEDIDSVVDQLQLSTVQQPAQLQVQLPAVELMRDFMSGKTVFRNLMAILTPGVNTLITERTSQIYGNLLEKAVHLSLEIIILVLGKDLQLADHWRPLYQLLIDNISRPAPNVTHLLLKFDLDTPIERTVLQPRFHYSCLRVILDMLEKLLGPDVNAMLHEFCFQHVDTIGVAPLPKRNSAQALRISSLHQLAVPGRLQLEEIKRAWLLKLLAVELHYGDFTNVNHRETVRKTLACLYGQDLGELEGDQDTASAFALQNGDNHSGTRTIRKNKALELLDIIQFRPPDDGMDFSQVLSNKKCGLLAEEVLRSSASDVGSVYYYSERGDRLIDLASFRDRLWQLSSFGNEVELTDLREAIQQLLRWAWKYNRNLEEQAAQLHMLTGWSQTVEVDRFVFSSRLLDGSLSASASPDCSLKMALLLTQVALTCMAKLRDERYLYAGGLNSDTVTAVDVIMLKQLPNGACLSMLFKLTLAMLRHESSEALRRRQYALLLSYFQYCQHMLDPDVPKRVLQLLLGTDHDSEVTELEKVDKEQAELTRANFSILRKEAQAILDLEKALETEERSMVIKDATQGSESGKTISHFVLDAFICIDHEKFFLNQLQSRGFLRSCLMSIGNFSLQIKQSALATLCLMSYALDGRRTMESLQRACTLEAELALLLRISHKYGKAGAQVLSSMAALEYLASCKAVNMPLKGSLRRLEAVLRKEFSLDIDKQQAIVAPVLRLVLSLTSLVDTSDFFEVKNKIVREVIEFVKAHPSLFDRVLQENVLEADDLMIELVNLVVAILSKVWPYEENDEYGFVQGLFRMMRDLFSQDAESFFSVSVVQSPVNQRRLELNKFHIGFRLTSYLYFLVTKKGIRLQMMVGQQQPTLGSLCQFLNIVTNALERGADEKSLLLNKIQDINELSRQEVDDVINMYAEKDRVSSSDNTNTRRYIAMVVMCQIVGNRDQLVTLLLLLAEHLLNVLLIHFQDTSFVAGASGTLKAIMYTSDVDSIRDLPSLCGKLLSILERLELLNEGWGWGMQGSFSNDVDLVWPVQDKVGHSLKVFRRLVTSLKEITLRKLAS